MTAIPEDAFPRKLKWLILTNNEIERLPESIGCYQALQKCMLAGNRLSALPDSMARCRKLGLVRLSSNQLTQLPDWIFELPELSFLSYAGNPCSRLGEGVENPALDEIAWGNLEVGKLLGEGASGIISQGTWSKAARGKEGEKETVAVKIFKGEVTSDGSPMDEMDACILAGQHPHLISPLGKIYGHPEEKKGLVMELIPPVFTNLGGPPNFQTCTRDTFPAGTTLSLGQVLKISVGIARAAMHLHERGIAHGDLYAHNILVDGAGHALLGDFGAATVYDKSGDVKDRFEKMEVLAFGHLVEDLLGLVVRDVDVEGESVFDEKDGYIVEGLNAVHWMCSAPVIDDRPVFASLLDSLEAL